MADDPDRGLDSDDMLRAAREGIAKPPPTPEDDSSKTPDVQAAATEPNLDAVESTHPGRGQTPMVTSCEIRRTGNLVVNVAAETVNLFISRDIGLRELDQNYELMVEGQETARITTSLRRTRQFSGASLVRETRVVFANSPPWLIQAVEPGPRDTYTTIFGNTKDVTHGIYSRVIRVLENDQPIASSDGPFVAVAVGRRFTLSPAEKAKRGTIDEQATLQRHGSPWTTAWSVTAREPVPLAVVLLYWHVLLGDWP